MRFCGDDASKWTTEEGGRGRAYPSQCFLFQKKSVWLSVLRFLLPLSFNSMRFRSFSKLIQSSLFRSTNSFLWLSIYTLTFPSRQSTTTGDGALPSIVLIFNLIHHIYLQRSFPSFLPFQFNHDFPKCNLQYRTPSHLSRLIWSVKFSHLLAFH